MLLADKAYAHDPTRRALRRRRIPHTIPERSDQVGRRAAKGSAGGRPPDFDKQLYRQRNVVERCFNRLKQWRDLATRYAKRANIYQSSLPPIAAIIWGSEVPPGRNAAADRSGRHAGGSILGALCVYGDGAENPEDALVALQCWVAAPVAQYLERRRAEELAVELARPEDEFRTGVAHELRTALSVITMTTSTLKEELDDLSAEQQRQYLHTPSPATLNASPRWPRTYSTWCLESGT